MLVVIYSDFAWSITLNETADPENPPNHSTDAGGNEFVSIIEKLDK